MYDVIVVGAGVSGCAVAYYLARYPLKTLVVEQGSDVAVATSRANSGIVHAGYAVRPGTLMAGLNVRGAAMLPELCRKLAVPFQQTGSLVVAKAGEEEQLKDLLRQGRANGVPDLVILGRDEVLGREPMLSPFAEAALYAPTAGIISPWELTLALARVAAANGVEFSFNTRVTGVLTEGGRVLALDTDRGTLAAKVVVNAAGVHADLLARMAGAERYDITPRKGEYMVLDRDLEGFVRHVVFPLPTRVSKGILVLPTTEGNILVGPTAQDVEDRMDVSTTSSGLAQLRTGAAELFPSLPLGRVIRSFAGLRAVADTDDFVIRSSGRVAGWIDVGGIQSPGLTAAPAIGQDVARLVTEQLRPEEEKELVIPPPPPRLWQMPLADRQTLIEANPLYGHIICRCEGVSEGEVVDALKDLVPATTLDGIRQRTRAGAGRCQGGFCQPRLIGIIARELGISPLAVTQSGPGSEVLAARLMKGGSAGEED